MDQVLNSGITRNKVGKIVWDILYMVEYVSAHLSIPISDTIGFQLIIAYSDQ